MRLLPSLGSRFASSRDACQRRLAAITACALLACRLARLPEPDLLLD
jgi:hypothetical protein